VIWKATVRDRRLQQVAKVTDRDILEAVGPVGGGRLWSPDGGRSMVVATQNRENKQIGFYTVDLMRGTSARLFEEDRSLPFGPILNLDVSGDGRRIVYVAQDARHPPDVWLTDPGFQNRRQLTNLNPQLETAALGTSRIIDWRSVDGVALQGALLLPANYQAGKRYPLVVDVYGGAYLSDAVNYFYLTPIGNMQLLASQGYAVLMPDAPVGRTTPMQDLLKTVLPGVDRAIELGIADPDRLGVMGHSYGGYSTLP